MHLNVLVVSSDCDLMSDATYNNINAKYIREFIETHDLCGRVLLKFTDVVSKEDLYKKFSKTDKKKIDDCLQRLEKTESLIHLMEFDNTYRPSAGVADIIKAINTQKKKENQYMPRKRFMSGDDDYTEKLRQRWLGY